MKRPAFQFYPADWRKDAELQSCSMTARGLWHEAMCIMHECEPYGELRVNGKPMTIAQLARLVGMTLPECKRAMEELEAAGVPSQTEDGAIYSRRMVKDEQLRAVRAAGGNDGAKHGAKGAEHGRKGGRPRKQTGDKKPPLDPPPSSSSSSSTSVALSSASEDDASELNRLSKILRLDTNDHRRHVNNLRVLLDLKAEGCDFQRHILPAAERAARSGPKTSLAYIREACFELRDAAATVAALPSPFENTDARGWRDRLRVFRQNGGWAPKWGPPPDQPGCKCPAEILQEAA